MKVCIIGGSGHVGRFMAPMLVEGGHEVSVVARTVTPVPSGGAWEKVTVVAGEYRRDDPQWAQLVAALGAEVIIDMLGVDVPGTYTAARGTCRHFIACGSLWMYGEPRVVPTPEVAQNPCMFKGYAIRYDEMRETIQRAAADGIAFTGIMPPNICGPGKIPLDGWGGRGIEVHAAHRRGDPVPLPEPGQTLIGPCDAEDIARAFVLAVQQRDHAAGQIFNVGSRYALTAVQFVETYGRIYGVNIPIDWHSWQRYSTTINPDLGANFHLKAHMCPDLTKIMTRLGYAPRYTPEETMERAVAWMRDEGLMP